MAYDIYGSTLRPGHCEVHPQVHEEYPCGMCYLENERQSMLREQEPIDNRLHPDDPLNGVKVIADALQYVGTYGAGHGLEGMKQWGQVVTWCRDAVRLLNKAEEDYRGLATCAANNGLKATAKDAIETADYIKAFSEGKS